MGTEIVATAGGGGELCPRGVQPVGKTQGAVDGVRAGENVRYVGREGANEAEQFGAGGGKASFPLRAGVGGAIRLPSGETRLIHTAAEVPRRGGDIVGSARAVAGQDGGALPVKTAGGAAEKEEQDEGTGRAHRGDAHGGGQGQAGEERKGRAAQEGQKPDEDPSAPHGAGAAVKGETLGTVALRLILRGVGGGKAGVGGLPLRLRGGLRGGPRLVAGAGELVLRGGQPLGHGLSVGKSRAGRKLTEPVPLPLQGGEGLAQFPLLRQRARVAVVERLTGQRLIGVYVPLRRGALPLQREAIRLRPGHAAVGVLHAGDEVVHLRDLAFQNGDLPRLIVTAEVPPLF